MESVFIVSGARTAIGSFGGSLKDIPPARTGALVIAEAIRRAMLNPSDVQHVVLGQVVQTIPQDAFLARVAAVHAGIPVEASALTLNRLCGSGVQAIISGAQMIALGECDIVVAGGAESMSRSPHHVTAARFGQKMGDMTMTDALIAVLSDPFEAFIWESPPKTLHGTMASLARHRTLLPPKATNERQQPRQEDISPAKSSLSRSRIGTARACLIPMSMFAKTQLSRVLQPFAPYSKATVR